MRPLSGSLRGRLRSLNTVFVALVVGAVAPLDVAALGSGNAAVA